MGAAIPPSIILGNLHALPFVTITRRFRAILSGAAAVGVRFFGVGAGS
jgi:hypothetical protein